jgi:hypothetical protein
MYKTNTLLVILLGWETWSLITRKESERKVLRKITIAQNIAEKRGN